MNNLQKAVFEKIFLNNNFLEELLEVTHIDYAIQIKLNYSPHYTESYINEKLRDFDVAVLLLEQKLGELVDCGNA